MSKNWIWFWIEPGEKKESYAEEPLEKFWWFASVGRNDTTQTKEIKYNKDLSGETPYKISFVIFSCAAFVRFPKYAKSGQKKDISVGEPLEKSCLFPSVIGTDITSNKEIKYKKDLSGGTPWKIPVVIFSCAAFVGLPKEVKSF